MHRPYYIFYQSAEEIPAEQMLIKRPSKPYDINFSMKFYSTYSNRVFNFVLDRN